MILTTIVVVRDDLERFSKTIHSLFPRKPSENIEWQLIVIDSSERNIEIENHLHKYRTPSALIEYFWTKPQGIYSAMNFGAEKAKGEYIHFINCGDCMTEAGDIDTILEHCQSNYDWFTVDILDQQQNRLICNSGLSFRNSLWGIKSYCHQSQIIKRDFFYRIGNYAIIKKVSADYFHTMLMLMRQKPGHFCYPVIKYEGYGFSHENASILREEKILSNRQLMGRASLKEIGGLSLLSLFALVQCPKLIAVLHRLRKSKSV